MGNNVQRHLVLKPAKMAGATLVGAAAGAAAGAILAWDASMAPGAAGDTEDVKLLKTKYRVAKDDVLTLISAMFSSWIYTTGSQLVVIKDSRKELTAAAYYEEDGQFEEEDIKGFIPNGRILVREGETKDKWENVVLKLRYLDQASLCVFVKQKNTEPLVKGQTTSVKGEITSYFRARGYDLPLDIGGEEDAQVFNAGCLSPSSAFLIMPVDGKMTMFIAWQGTQVDLRPLDLFTDAAAAPARCHAWNKTYPELWAHSAIMAKTCSDVLTFKSHIIQILNARKVQRVVFTGHSLGGGMALLAHMLALAEEESEASEEKLDESLEIQSITFAAPMVWYLPKGEEGLPEDIRDLFHSTSKNFVFDADVVPRMPGLMTFARPALTHFVEKMVMAELKKFRFGEETYVGNTLQKLASSLCNSLLTSAGNEATFKELANYCHLSKIMYFEKQQTEPLELNDSDFKARSTFHKEENFDHKYILACHSFFPNCLYPHEASIR